jgi:hypothetical protein
LESVDDFSAGLSVDFSLDDESLSFAFDLRLP